MIEYSHCSLRFSAAFSLVDIDWQIEPGQVWAILGPNGSGKSALASSLAGEGEVQSGERRLGGWEVSLVSLEAQSRLIDRERLRDDSDLTDEVSEGTPTGEMIDEVCQDEELKSELIEAFKLRNLLARGFRKLSTGETRKVLIIRALTCEADILVLDEPFEGLDTDAINKVGNLLANRNPSIPLVLVFNRLEELPDFVTNILYLDAGRVTHRFVCGEHNPISEVKKTLAHLMHLRTADLQLPRPESVIARRLNRDSTLVRLRNAKVSYTENLVFEGLDWSINPGEHWQVSGPNGSGKTCLLNLITGDHPQCYVNDIAIFGYQRGEGESIWDIKQYIGFVSSALHWDYRLSVGVRNVIVSGFYDSIGLYQKATGQQLEIADAWLRLLGMEGKRGDPFSGLSYGEQQLLLIARAMVKHPLLLLLDEPCLGLDDINRHLVLALVERICTATYGSELAPQVQKLRELRDNSLLSTESGTNFMNSFNDFYYSFSPVIADYERENPVFKEAVKIAITPMITSLSILNYVDMDSEIEVLGYGISLILLNIGMYFVAPAIMILRIRK